MRYRDRTKLPCGTRRGDRTPRVVASTEAESCAMTIQLPKDLDEHPGGGPQWSLRLARRCDVGSGGASPRTPEQEQRPANPPNVVRQQPASEAHKPIWDVIEEENRSIPQEVWDALPADLAEQHDHYVYGTPKRPTA